MTRDDRPLSPGLQIYRPQLTSVLSIFHRLTGVALSIGSPLLVYWLTFSLFFHLCNGIRHLFWDAGYGFDLQTIYASGWTVVAVSIALSLMAWIISVGMKG
jgi:succinate dehydrogenase / fumarate reductase cytochrome b subunit